MNDFLSIISVVYRDPRFWERNLELTRKLNPQGGFHWFVVDNSPTPVLDSTSAPDITVLDGAERPASRDSGSMHHALGIHRALSQVETRYVMILDHDFYIVMNDWIRSLTASAERRGISFFGAPWHPRWNYQHGDFPSVHCMLIDLDAVSRETLDFKPAIDGDRWWHWINQRHRFLPEPIRLRLKTGRIRDTGWNIRKRYRKDENTRRELLRAVYERPNTTGALIERLFDGLIPDDWKLYPAANRALVARGFLDRIAPPSAILGWEEFFWDDVPFGFHLRRVGRTNSGDRTEFDLKLLDEVIDHYATS